MSRVLVLLAAVVAAGVVFFTNSQGPVEACGTALITFLLVLIVGLLLTRPKKKREE